MNETCQSTTERSGRVTTRRCRSIGSLAVMAAVVTIAGCSGEDVAERVIEDRIEEELEREGGGDVDIDLDSGEFRIETEDGVIQMETDDEGNISIEGPEGDISVDTDDGVTVIEGDDGQTRIEQGAGLPEDFPDSVPLPDGFEAEFYSLSTTSDGSGWILGGSVDTNPADLAESYFAALESAGFVRQSVTETPDSVIFGFDDGEYGIYGMAGTEGGETYVNITVAESEQ